MRKFWSERRRKKAERKALKHSVRLYSEALDVEEAKSMLTWLSASELHEQEFEASMRLLDDVDALEDDGDILLLSQTGDSQPGDGYWIRRKSLAIAAVISLFAVLLGGFGLLANTGAATDKGVQLVQYSTEVGERKTVILADSSQIELNTDSRLIVDFSGPERRTILARGEAYFDIAPDETRPFIVELGGRAITVLGTSFNVRKADTGETTIAVTEGVVAVHRADETVNEMSHLINLDTEGEVVTKTEADRYRLEKGAVVVLRDNAFRVTSVPAEDVSDSTAWREGLIRFEAEPLGSVVREIGRYTDDRIVIEDPRVLSLKLNAVLRVEKIEAIFEGLEQTLPIRVVRKPRHIYITYDDDRGTN